MVSCDCCMKLGVVCGGVRWSMLNFIIVLFFMIFFFLVLWQLQQIVEILLYFFMILKYICLFFLLIFLIWWKKCSCSFLWFIIFIRVDLNGFILKMMLLGVINKILDFLCMFCLCQQLLVRYMIFCGVFLYLIGVVGWVKIVFLFLNFCSIFQV